MIKQKRKDQELSVEKVLQEFKTSDRTTLVRACGTGKTLCGIWINEELVKDLPHSTTLVLLPSLALMKQTINEYRAQFHPKGQPFTNDKFIAVCSDKTVAEDDSLEEDLEELDFLVYEEPSDIVEFLNSPNGHKIVFSTYQSTDKVGEAVDAMKHSFNFGLFDEAHRTASVCKGKKESLFSYALSDENISIAKRLFMTATPKHFALSSKLDKETPVFSMCNKEIYGQVAHTLSFKNAVDLGIITPVKICIAFIEQGKDSDNNLKSSYKIKDSTLEKVEILTQLAIQKATKTYGIKKLIGFTRTVEEAEKYANDYNLFDERNDFRADYVSGSMNSSLRTEKMEKFRHAERSIMFNARCLTEGVDVPSVDGVVFVANKKSKIDIVQAAGRAMRVSPGKEFGYVILPIFCDSNVVSETGELENNTDYSFIYDTVKSLVENDEQMISTLTEGLRRSDSLPTRAKVSEEESYSRPVISLEFIGDLHNLDKVLESIKLNIVQSITLSYEWTKSLEGLKSFYGIHRRFPKSLEVWQDQSIGSWLAAQKHKFKTGTLAQYRIKALDDAVPGWNLKLVKSWEESFQDLLSFYKETGKLPVKGQQGNPFISVQRKLKHKRKLDQNKEKLLNENFPNWYNYKITDWEIRLDEIVKFINLNKRYPVSTSLNKNEKILRAWLNTQRQSLKDKTLSNERVAKLNEAIPEWNISTTVDWDESLAKLIDFISIHNRTPKQLGTVEGERKLGCWLVGQRGLFSKGELQKERIEKLNSAFPDWNLTKLTWDDLLQAYIEFVKISGKIPKRRQSEQETTLSTWIYNQRVKHKSGNLSTEKVNKLNSLIPGWNNVE